MLSAAAAPYFSRVHDHLLRAADNVEAIDHLLSDVLQANTAQVNVRQSQIALRQNEDMRRISAWAAIALVPTAVAGIYGMNFDHMPELRWQYGYPLVVGVIVAICGSLYFSFRARHWLGASPVALAQAEGIGRARRELKNRAKKPRRVGRAGSGS